MTSSQIRTLFLSFFEARGHRVVPSSSLVPANDPTLLFSNAGMNQFKDVFLGRERRDYARACSSQKCVRAGGKHNDLEQVGRTTRHHTFFEMLGNFSFGDYFKKDAIPWAWELITKDFAIPRQKLYVTVFREDDEAAEIWAKDVGVPRERIFRLDEKDNFWQMGETGPCGPCSEIHYDLGPKASDAGHTDCKFPCDCGRYVELWNLVFMQFNRDEQGAMTPLPRPSIDTGAGLERLATALLNLEDSSKFSNYDTDLFRPLIDEAATLASVEYGANHDTDVSLRIITDHARAATFLISDGVLPSNEGRGYILRLIMRRALYHGQTLGLNEPFLYKMAGHVVQMMKDAYPELAETEHHVAKATKKEEEQYARTTRIGIEKLESALAVLSTGEELPYRLTHPLRRAIAQLGDCGELREAYASSKPSADDPASRAALEEFEKGWDLEKQWSALWTRIGAKFAKPPERGGGSIIELQSAVKRVPPYRSLRARIETLLETLGKDSVFRVDIEARLNRLPPPGLPGWIPGDELFKLHDTYGLRPDFVVDIVKNNGLGVDLEGYEAERERQRERGRASWKGKIEGGFLEDRYAGLATSSIPQTAYDPYGSTVTPDAQIMAIVLPSGLVPCVEPGSTAEIVLSETCFYAAAGGQVGDTGEIRDIGGENPVARIQDTKLVLQSFVVHTAQVSKALQVGMRVMAVVDADRRNAIRRNHTATHLLHAALRKTLGTHVKQAGSLVAPDRLRFDFTHYAALDEQDLLDIEDLVNEHILKNEIVTTEAMDLDKAVDSGAMALFGEKYADQVRVLSVEDFSKELCGGTHVERTGDIGLFKILSESSVSAGTRRIEAVTGTGVLEQIRKANETLAMLSDALRSKPEELVEAAEKLTESEKKLRKQLEAQQMKRAASEASDLVGQAREVKGVRVVAARVEVTDRSAMRQMVDDLRAKLQSGVIVLASVADGKVALIAAVTKDLTAKLDAGKIVKQAAAYVEGSGGGRKDLAEAGGKNPSRLDESLQAVPGIIERML
jgi:alanyl-tRNA synthetase